ncbi:MAG: hypothetical protein AAF208_06230 [Cyanobacteria bacterium P01_A01_bin.45]
MPFQKNHKLGAKKIYARPLDKQIIGFKGYEGQKEKLKNIPDWQKKLRDYVNLLIEEHGE